MGLALKKPDDAAGAAWPAILIGLFVAFVSRALEQSYTQVQLLTKC